MIEYVQGNLLEADVEAVVNTVNTVGVMGKGIALQFKKAYPGNFQIYEKACRAGEVVPGKMLVVRTGFLTGPRYIFNFPTKRHWKGRARLEDVGSGLADLVKQVRSLGIESIAIPPLGCGNGGLDWAEVRPVIEAAVEPLETVKVMIYGPGPEPSAHGTIVRTSRPGMTPGRAAFLGLLNSYVMIAPVITLIEIQKLTYFLQRAGERLNLKFERAPYGPYSDQLNHVLERLEGHFVRGYSGSRKPAVEIFLVGDALDEPREYLETLPETKRRINQVSQLVEGFEYPLGLELLATVDWVAGEDASAAESPVAALERIHAWNSHKRAFRPREVELAWRRLRDTGWISTRAS